MTHRQDSVIYMFRGKTIHYGDGATRHAHRVVMVLLLHAKAFDAEGERLCGEKAYRKNGPYEEVWGVKVLAKLAAALVVDIQNCRGGPRILENADVNQNGCETLLIRMVNPIWDVVAVLGVQRLRACGTHPQSTSTRYGRGGNGWDVAALP